MKRIALVACVLWAVGASGCGPKNIPGLAIELSDTPEHRALLSVLDRFKQAFEREDVDALVALASPRFYENAGTNETADDYNYDGLREHFTGHFEKVDKPSLDIHLRDVSIEEDQAIVDYRYVARYLMKLPSGEKWKVTDDINRMKLVREDDDWKILSGM